MEINKRQLKKWIAALDSGQYSQSGGVLHNHLGYCCLGVGCRVLIPDELLRFTSGSTRFIAGALPDSQPNAPEWLNGINDDFRDKTGRTLSPLNDSGGFSFSELATLLELVYIHKILD
jgi:hypothetical protein